jgi:hypothetical protein
MAFASFVGSPVVLETELLQRFEPFAVALL